MAFLLHNKKSLVVNLVSVLFEYILSNKMGKMPGSPNNRSFMPTFISKVGEALNTPSLIFHVFSKISFSGGGPVSQKGGEENEKNGGEPPKITFKERLNKSYQATKDNFKRALLKTKRSANNAIKEVADRAKDLIGTSKPTVAPSKNCFTSFNFDKYAKIMAKDLEDEIVAHKSDFFDKFGSGLEGAIVKSRGDLIEKVIVPNMQIAYSSIGQLGSEINTVFLYQLLQYEFDMLGQAISAVVSEEHEKQNNNSTGKSDYTVMLRDPSIIQKICINMQNSIMKQLRKERSQVNSSQFRKRVGGGRTKRRSYVKRIMRKRTIKRLRKP
jgi:hypothetical protein